MSVVVISTVTFVLGTMPELTDNLDIMLFDNETEVDSDKDCWPASHKPVWMFADLVSEFEQCGHHTPPQHSPASGEVGGGELYLVSSN